MARRALVGIARVATACLAVVACGQSSAAPRAEVAVPQAGTPPPQAALTREAIGNATIAGVFDDPVVLKAGRYEGPPLGPGGTARRMLLLLANLVQYADLDGTPGDEAIALLAESSGGSGERIYLAAIGVREGRAASLGVALVGDRTRIRQLSLDGRTIVLDVVEAGPGDAACCPTQVARKFYGVAGGKVTLSKSEVSGKVSAALLSGTDWTVVEIDGQPLPDEAPRPTIRIDADRIAGFGGCNRYTGTLKEPTPGALAMGPIAATRMACAGPPADVERRFLDTLGKVTRYSFVAGRVVLDGIEAGARRSLLLVRS
jgi:heat shock protein HslJ